MAAKKNNLIWLFGILGVLIALWLSAILIVPKLSNALKAASAECRSDATSPACEAILGNYGATGDVFGAITALFSGIGLFAVAVTLWSEARARRVERKPLVVSYLDSDSIILDSPQFQPNTIRMKLIVEIANQGEPAINVSVAGKLIFRGSTLTMGTHFVEVPMVSGGTFKVEFAQRFLDGNLTELLGAVIGNEQVEFAVVMSCQSLEGVNWETRVRYRLSCPMAGGKTRLQALGQDNEREHWEGDAAVALAAKVTPGSWQHSEVG